MCVCACEGAGQQEQQETNPRRYVCVRACVWKLLLLLVLLPHAHSIPWLLYPCCCRTLTASSPYQHWGGGAGAQDTRTSASRTGSSRGPGRRGFMWRCSRGQGMAGGGRQVLQ